LDRPDFVIGSAQQMIPEHQRRFPGVPLIYVPHSLIAPFEVQTMPWPSLLQRWVSAGVFHYLELRALNQARSTIRFTRAGCEALMAYYGKSLKPRFVVLPTPVPIPNLPGDFDGMNSKRHPHLRLLYVGRLVESKNVAWLLRCLNRLNHFSWTCDIVGDGEERPHLEKLTLQRGLENRIVFHGHQDDVGSFYRQADLLIFPSRLENSPIVLLEAMSFGVPSLSIRADGQRYINANHEIITAGHDGFLAEGEEQFVQKLQELLISPDCLKTVGRNARQTVEKRHRWVDHIRGYERIFEEITGTSGRPSRNEETQPCLR
jgi:glycosyltransferase involved in cell wall biosynthesis